MHVYIYVYILLYAICFTSIYQTYYVYYQNDTLFAFHANTHGNTHAKILDERNGGSD